jgi:hypothetical protein
VNPIDDCAKNGGFTASIANRVASLSDKLGQQQVNTMDLAGRISPETIWLIDGALRVDPIAREASCSHF